MATNIDERIVREHYKLLTLKLIEKGLTITAMESATGGQIASLITDTEGSSSVFKGSCVTYSNDAKCQEGVPREVIETYSVYSFETACVMAGVVRKKFGADIGIGITGTMGNVDPQNREASVPGKVYFAIADREGTDAYVRDIPVQPSRLMYKLMVAEEIFKVLCKEFDIGCETDETKALEMRAGAGSSRM